jgi:hypothetical protein
MRSPCCLPVCVCLLKQLIDIHGIQQGGDAIEGDLNAIIFNPIA